MSVGGDGATPDGLATRRASAVCPHCSHVNLKLDQELYWSRGRVFVALETVLQGVVTAIVLFLTYLILTSGQVGLGKGHGFGIGLPIMLGWLGWQTVAMLTRRTGLLNFGLVWGVILTIMAPIAALASWAAWTQGWSLGRFAFFGAIALTVVGLLSFTAGRHYRAWQTRYLARRTAKHLAAA